MTAHNDIRHITKAVACGMSSATAAGTGDGTAVTGATIDRLGFESARLDINYLTTLTADKTLTYAVAYQTSDDAGSTWATAVALQAATTAATGALTASLGIVSFGLDLRTLPRYIRFNFTPEMNASGTDTALSSAVCILGGAEVAPTA